MVSDLRAVIPTDRTKLWRLAVCHVFLSSPDSPFQNGQGNDYLFAGNMVYTVSISLAFIMCVCVCITFSFFFKCMCLLAIRCLHIFASAQCLCTHQLPLSHYEPPVTLYSSSHSVSSPLLRPSFLSYSHLHHAAALSFYSLQSHVKVSDVYLLYYVCVGCRGLSLQQNINVYYLHCRHWINPLSLFFVFFFCLFLFAFPLPCVCLCVVCGSYSVS